MVSPQIEMILDNLQHLNDADLVVLTDEMVSERQRRGLYQKTSAPGYFAEYQSAQRVYRKNRNGRNERLRDSRKAAKMTQQELAARLGLSTSNISDYETGARRTPKWVMETIERWEANGIM